MILSYFRPRKRLCNRKPATARLGQQAGASLRLLSQGWVSFLIFNGMFFQEGHFLSKKRPEFLTGLPDAAPGREKSAWQIRHDERYWVLLLAEFATWIFRGLAVESGAFC